MIYPKSLEELILYFKKLPGIGEKSAERLALSIIDFSIEDSKSFSKAILKAREKLIECEICSHLTEDNICNICSDTTRNKDLICVVEDFKSIFILEKMGKFRGTYHVLNGLISPIDGINPENLNLESLIKRCETKENIELILALKSSVEAEATSMYITKILQNKNIKISRLSYGIPMGAEIDYLDSLTLERAMQDRQILSEK